MKPCSGIIVSSFSKSMESSQLQLDNLLIDESLAYRKYTLPSYMRGKINLECSYVNGAFFADVQWKNNLRIVRIYFDAPTFDRITRDRSAKFVDMLSAIGGTMGLLTGFSIISGVEILYFAGKIFFGIVYKKRNDI